MARVVAVVGPTATGKSDLGIALVGLDVEAKAALVEEAFWAACPYGPADFADVTTTLVRTDKDDLITSSETSVAPYMSRMVYSRRKNTVEMLGDELQNFGSDPVFEDSIRLATRLLP